MSIVFLILKIIGILFLVLLCLLLLILFHPVFYQIEGESEEEISLQGYFWWLFQILRLEFWWEDQEFRFRLRIFGFSRNLGEEETEEEEFAESAAGERETSVWEERDSETEGQEGSIEKFVSEKDKNLADQSAAAEAEYQIDQSAVKEAEYQTEQSATGEEECQTEQSATGEKECQTEQSAAGEKECQTEQSAAGEKECRTEQSAVEKNISQKENNVSGSSKEKKKKAKTQKKAKKGKKENGILDRFKGIRQEAADERNRRAVSHLWRELCYLLAHLKPKYVKAEISFSTGDPALTGEVTGGLSLFPLIYRYDAHIYPDFLAEEFYIKGSLKMKGHIAVFHFLKILIRLFLDKDVKRLYNKFK